jgi:shikimate 5-dehydrogenase
MNVFQAASAFKLWTNKEMPIDLVRRIAFEEDPAASQRRRS